MLVLRKNEERKGEAMDGKRFCFSGKRILCLLLCCLLLPGMTSHAAGEPDLGIPCAIEVHLKTDDGMACSAREIHLLPVAEAKLSGEQVTYLPVGVFEDSGISLEELEKESTAQILSEFAKTHPSEDMVRTSDEGGLAEFPNLKAGLYLITIADDGSGLVFEPFLANVPRKDGTDYSYRLHAFPKMAGSASDQSYVTLTVKKRWNDHGKNRPKSITAELLRDGSVVDEYLLSDENDWTHTWDGLEHYYVWSAKEKEVPKGYVVSYEREGNVFYVINTAILLQTGQLQWPIPVMAGAGIFLLLFGMILKKRAGTGKE